MWTSALTGASRTAAGPRGRRDQDRLHPSSTDRLLWRHGHRPVRISKYGTGMAALHADLPAHPWRRVLDRHVTP